MKKLSGGTTTVYIFSGTKVIAEYLNGAAPASPTREYIYSGSQLLAKIEAGSTNYYHSDHLSARVITDSAGTVSGQRGHYPYGETWYETGTTTKIKLTSYERDSESGNDYAVFRSYVNRLGRFSSPDPLAGGIANPQSLNRYAYVGNNPLNLVDPLGLTWFCTEVAGERVCVWYDDPEPSSSPIGGALTGLGWDRGEGGGGRSGPAYRIVDRAGGGGNTSSTMDNRASALANALNNTGIQSLANPCTPGAWYLASAGGAVAFSATPVGGTVFPATKTAIDILRAIYYTAEPGVQRAVKEATAAAVFVSVKAVQGCGSLQ